MADIFDQIAPDEQAPQAAPPAPQQPRGDVFDEVQPEGPSVGRQIAGLGIEIGGGTAGNIAGAALAPFTFGVSYPVLSFAGGYGSSIAAQEFEGRDDISQGRAIANGLLNIIPGGDDAARLIRGGKIGEKVVSEAAENIVRSEGKKALTRRLAARGGVGAAMGAADQTITTYLDEGRIPTFNEMGLAIGSGLVMGAGFDAVGLGIGKAGAIVSEMPTTQSMKNILNKVGGKTPAEAAPIIQRELDRGNEDIKRLLQYGRQGVKTQMDYDVGNMDFSPSYLRTPAGEGTRAANALGLDPEAFKRLEIFDRTLRELGQDYELRTDPLIAAQAQQLEQSSGLIRNNAWRGQRQQTTPDARFNNLRAKLDAVFDYVLPGRAVGDDVAERVQFTSKNAINTIRDRAGAFQKRAREAVWRSDDPDAILNGIDDYMSGRTDSLGAIPMDLRNDLRYIRETRNNLQREVVAELNLSPELKNKIAESNGHYLTQEYRMFVDKSYRPSEEQFVRARNAIVARIKEESGDKFNEKEAIDRASNYLANLKSKDGFDKMFYGAEGGSPTGILKQKNLDLLDEVKDYLGDIDDPIEKLYGTTTKLVRLVEGNRQQKFVTDRLLKTGLASPAATPEHSTVVKGKYGQPDIYTTEAVASSLNRLTSDNWMFNSSSLPMQFVGDFYNSAVGLSKATKVVLNPISYSVQAIGNMFLAASTHGVSWNGLKKGAHIALENTGVPLRWRKGRAYPDYNRIETDLDDMKRFGMLDQNVTLSDMRAGFEKGRMGQMIDGTLGPISEAYQYADNTYRAMVWYTNQDTVRKMYPGMNVDEVKQMAADWTNATFPNYSRIHKGIRTASRWGVLDQFFAFTAEYIRTQVNAGRLAHRLMRVGKETGNEAMVSEGRKRAATLYGTYAAVMGAVQGYNKLKGVSGEEEDALREVAVPNYDKGKMLTLQITNNGERFEYANPSYLAPQAIGLNLIDAAMDGQLEDPAVTANRIVELFSNDVLGEGSFVARGLAQALLNAREGGRGVITNASGLTNIKERGEWFLADTFTPGFVREWNRLSRAFEGSEGAQGQVYTKQQTANRLLGFRTYGFDIDKSATSNIRNVAIPLNDAKADYGAALNQNLNDAELSLRYDKANNSKQQQFAQLERKIKALRTLGRPNDRIMEILKEGGISNEDALYAMEGMYNPINPSPDPSSGEVYDESISWLSPDARMDMIKGYKKSDPILARRLLSIEQGRRKDEKLGKTPMDKAIAGLSKSQRARYFSRKIEQLPESQQQGYLKLMREKRLLDREVELQMQMLR